MEIKYSKNVKILSLIFVILSVIYTFYASCSQRGLFLDGSYYLIQMLENISNNKFEVFTSIYRPRVMTQVLQEFPTVFLGIVLGIKSKIVLANIFSFTMFGLPLLALWWNFELTKRTKEYGIFFWSFFTYCLMILMFHIFSEVETIIGIPFQFVLLNYLFGKINYTKLDKLGIAFILLLMFGIYEHTIFLGLIIFAGTFIAAFDEENGENMLVKICIGAGSLASAFYTLFFIIFNANEQDSFMRFFKETYDFWVETTRLSLLIPLVTLILLCGLFFKSKKLNSNMVFFFSSVYFFIFIKMFSNLKIFLNPMYELHTRSIVCWAVPLIFLGIVIYKFKIRNAEKKDLTTLLNNAYIPVLLCGITLTAWQIVHTYYWNQNIAYLKNEINNCNEILYFPEEHEEISSFYNDKLRRYIWHGNYAATQIIFDDNYEINTLLMHYNEQEKEGDNSYRAGLWASPENNKIGIPYGTAVSIVNKFWNLEKVAKDLDDFNTKNNIQTNKP